MRTPPNLNVFAQLNSHGRATGERQFLLDAHSRARAGRSRANALACTPSQVNPGVTPGVRTLAIARVERFL